MANEHPKVVVLLSGGMDSAACVHFFTDQDYDVRGLFIDYGQAAAGPEREAAADVARHFDIQLSQFQCKGSVYLGAGEIRARNAFLVMAAAMWVPLPSFSIALGIHAGTPYVDCSEQFLSMANALLDAYTDGSVKCAAPFLDWSKGAIFTYCQRYGVPVELTYSCEAGSRPTCGVCSSCLDRRALDARTVQ
jgi:7-cyano-7-deazaguanine synthase